MSATISTSSPAPTLGGGQDPVNVSPFQPGPHWFGYLGFIGALVYRFPQIQKLLKTRRAKDISGPTFLCHNFAYVFMTLYLLFDPKKQKEGPDWLLLGYYFSGMTQNFLIFWLSKKFVAEQARGERAETGEQQRTGLGAGGEVEVVGAVSFTKNKTKVEPRSERQRGGFGAEQDHDHIQLGGVLVQEEASPAKSTPGSRSGVRPDDLHDQQLIHRRPRFSSSGAAWSSEMSPHARRATEDTEALLAHAHRRDEDGKQTGWWGAGESYKQLEEYWSRRRYFFDRVLAEQKREEDISLGSGGRMARRKMKTDGVDSGRNYGGSYRRYDVMRDRDRDDVDAGSG